MTNVADKFDVGAGGTELPPDSLQKISAAVAEMIQLEMRVEQLSADLQATNSLLHQMRTGRLPDLMAEAQQEECTVAGGISVKVFPFVSGSLPKPQDARKAALQYLEKNGASGLLKTELTLEFGKSQHKKAVALAKQLIKKGLAPTVEETIHAQTLQKFARDRMENGQPIDLEVLGLFSGRIAKLRVAKKKGGAEK